MRRKGIISIILIIVLLAVLAVRVDASTGDMVTRIDESTVATLQILKVNPEVSYVSKLGYQDLEERLSDIPSINLGTISRTNPGFVVNSSTYLLKINAPPPPANFLCGSQVFIYNFFLNTSMLNTNIEQADATIEVTIIDADGGGWKDRSLHPVSMPGRTEIVVPIETLLITQGSSGIIKNFDVYIRILPGSTESYRAGEKIMLIEWLLEKFGIF